MERGWERAPGAVGRGAEGSASPQHWLRERSRPQAGGGCKFAWQRTIFIVGLEAT